MKAEAQDKPNPHRGFWPLFWLLAGLWLVAVVIWGCPGAAPVQVVLPASILGIRFRFGL